MAKVLRKPFFARSTETVAKELLGKFLVRNMNGTIVAVMITETEAYDGPHDLASHASKGRTQRTNVMFGPAGNFYVYLIYGMYEMLNIVTGKEDYPAAVLIRGAITKDGKNLNGPGKLTKFFNINRTINAKPTSKETGLWVEDRNTPAGKIRKLPRVGVAYAGPIWSAKKLRFLLEQ